MTSPIPISENVSIVPPLAEELPGELTPVQKLLIEAARKEAIKGKLDACRQALFVIRQKISSYTASGNTRKLSIYQAKETECISKIEEFEKMLVPEDIAGIGGD